MNANEKLEQALHDQYFRRKVAADDAFRKRMLALQKQALRGGRNSNLKIAPGKSTKWRRSACASKGQGSWKSIGKTPPIILKIHGSAGIVADAYAERQQGSEFLDSNMLGLTASERAEEFALDAARHPASDPKNLFIHFSLSRPQNQSLSREVWQKTVRQFLNRIGAQGCNFVVTRHTKTDNDHVHVLVSRVLPIGRKLLSNSQNYWRWRAALREVEADLGITAADRSHQAELLQTPGSDRMVNAQRRSARLHHKNPFIEPHVIEKALSKAINFDQFSADLKAVGVNVIVTEKNGKVSGILFQKSGCDQALAGSSIDRIFSLPRIQSRININCELLSKTERLHMTNRLKLAQLHQESECHAQHVLER